MNYSFHGKRYFCIWMPALAIIVLFTVSQSTNACEGGVARVSGTSKYPPLTWREKDKLIGVSVELVEKLLHKHDIDVVADEGFPWKRVLLRARRGQVDILLSVRKTIEKEEFLQFLEPPITPSVQSVFVKVGKKIEFNQWSDLKGLAGTIILGASFGEEFDEFAKKSLYIEQVSTYEQGFKKLMLDRSDYFLGPLVPTMMFLEEQGVNSEIKFLEKPLVIIDEYLAVSKNSSCLELVPEMSAEIENFRNGLVVEELMDKYFQIWFTRNIKS